MRRKTIKLVIPGIPPSINTWRSMNHFTEARKKKEWEELVQWEVIRQKKRPPRPFQKAITVYRYYFPDRRRRDATNYSPKWIEDGLVKAGVLEDDSFDHVELVIEKGGVDKHNPRVEIEITEAS